MDALPQRYKKLIAAEMKNRGPRAVIESMVNVMLENTNNQQNEAVVKMHATLVEMLKHWPEDER